MMRTLRQIKNISGKRVLLRLDCNVPLRDGSVLEDFKIRQSLPTIEYLIERGAKIILVSHLGRPHGEELHLSLEPVRAVLQKMLRKKIPFFPVNQLNAARSAAADMRPGQLIMLENIRFAPGEETCSKAFSRELADLADMFVLDGFAVAHRRSASVSGVAQFLPGYAGLLLEKEVCTLSKLMVRPKKPLVVILGGVKLETKIPVLKKLLPLAQVVLLGGALANSFWAQRGVGRQKNGVSEPWPASWHTLLSNKKIILPIDGFVGLPNGQDISLQKFDEHMKLPRHEAIFDIGPETIGLYKKILSQARTVLWNGAMGFFEETAYQQGTMAVVETMARLPQALTLAGGGETVEVLRQQKLLSKVSFVSTGGGAMLDFLCGKIMPGIRAVSRR